MARVLNDQELRAVTSLTGSQRYSYFVKQVADSAVVWSLGSDTGWVLAADDQGRQVVPCWPHERLASACVFWEWSGNEPRPIELDAWLQKWLPGMIRDERMVAVFPTPQDKGVVINPSQLKNDLEEDLLKYE